MLIQRTLDVLYHNDTLWVVTDDSVCGWCYGLL